MVDPKQRGAMPPSDMARVAQQDIGKVARLFRDSGFRYRVFDSETGEHQIVDPVRPLPPMDHVPPVWPPPLSDSDPEPLRSAPPAQPVRARPAAVVAPPVAVAAPAPPAAAVQPAAKPAELPLPAPETSRAALRAQTETDRIFRAAALGMPAVEAAAAPPPVARPSVSQVKVPAPPVAPPKETNMSAKPTSSAETTARQVGRVVTLPARPEPPRAPAPEVAPATNLATPLRAPDGRTVASVMGTVLQPPAPPAKREPASTAALMSQLFAPRRKD